MGYFNLAIVWNTHDPLVIHNTLSCKSFYYWSSLSLIWICGKGFNMDDMVLVWYLNMKIHIYIYIYLKIWVALTEHWVITCYRLIGMSFRWWRNMRLGDMWHIIWKFAYIIWAFNILYHAYTIIIPSHEDWDYGCPSTNLIIATKHFEKHKWIQMANNGNALNRSSEFAAA